MLQRYLIKQGFIQCNIAAVSCIKFYCADPSGLTALSFLPPPGDLVLNGSSTLTLPATSLQHLTSLFEQYLLSRSHQHGFLALPSHPADTASLLQLQFLFDILQKTVSLKVFLIISERHQRVILMSSGPWNRVRF